MAPTLRFELRQNDFGDRLAQPTLTGILNWSVHPVTIRGPRDGNAELYQLSYGRVKMDAPLGHDPRIFD